MQNEKYFDGDVSFNAQHSPLGAFMSFTCGHFGTAGGFGLQMGKPGDQDVYVGIYKKSPCGSDQKSVLKTLPFYSGSAQKAAEAQFGLSAAQADGRAALVPYQKSEIKRAYAWATDTWRTDDFNFRIYTPHFDLPDLEQPLADEQKARLAVLPGLLAELEVDNTSGLTEVQAFFALGFPEPAVRPLIFGKNNVGFTYRGKIGVRGRCPDPTIKVELIQRWKVIDGFEPLANGPAGANKVHQLGTLPGIVLTVPPGKRATLELALGVHLSGVVTTGLEMSYWYTRYFPTIQSVMEGIYEYADSIRSRCEKLNHKLSHSGLSDDRQFLIAHSTRSYHGSTMLLDHCGRPFWAVNEGEYCMINTLDLSVDHLFWEVKHNPWVVRNVLDSFVRHYSYVDRVKPRNGAHSSPGGLSFCHDMGAFNNFSPQGHSSYELPDLDAACFSYMTAEQLCNWVLMAATYVKSTQDTSWALRLGPVIRSLAISLTRRAPNGPIELDSDRCGTGSEITTYDSLDHSLAMTRNNLYMAVKTWASHLALAQLLEVIGDEFEASRCKEMATKAAGAVVSMSGVNPDQAIPAVFEKDNKGYQSRILPAAEALVYLKFWGINPKNAAPELFDVICKHVKALLQDPQKRNLFADGGIRLSSTSGNSWMSKIALLQNICEVDFQFIKESWYQTLTASADKAHVKWQTSGNTAYHACCDQMLDGQAVGSRYYPRIVTTILWLTD